MQDFPGERFMERSVNDLQRALFWEIHEVLTATIPNCRLAVKWRVPFYIYLKELCYTNFFKDHLYISFLQGQLMDEHPLLIKEGSKMVAKYFIRTREDIANQVFLEILLASLALQESLYLRNTNGEKQSKSDRS